MAPDRPRRSLRRIVGTVAVGAIAIVVLYPVAKVLVPVLIVALVLALLVQAIKR